MSVFLLVGIVWSALLLGSYIAVSRNQLRLDATHPLLVVGLVALIARMLPNLLLPMGAGPDIDAYNVVAGVLEGRGDVYVNPASQNRHPYLPFWMYWLVAARTLSQTLDVPFVKVVRLAPIAADVVIALLLVHGLLANGRSKTAALQGGLLYALNPVAVFVSAYHGQFDALPLMLMLLAVYALEYSPLQSGLWLGWGILAKSWPVLILPVLVQALRRWRARALLVGIAVVVPLGGVLLYALLVGANPTQVIGRALGYNHGIGVWGYTYFVRMLGEFQPALRPGWEWVVQHSRYLTLLLLGTIWWVRARHEPVVHGVLTMLVAFFAVTHAFAIQYLVWLLPWAILGGASPWLLRYTVAAWVYMALAYSTLILEVHITSILPWPQADWFIIIPAGLPAWIVTVLWLRERLRGRDARTTAHSQGMQPVTRY